MNLDDDKAISQKCLRASLKLPVTDLRLGMFVVEPDCGWRNTPFILEGLLLSEAAEIELLSSLTTHVIVDPRRSLISPLAGMDAVMFYEDASSSAGLLGAHPSAGGDLASTTGETEEHFKNFISVAYQTDFSNRRPSLAEKTGARWRRWRSWIARFLHHGAGAESRPAPASSRPDYIPQDIPLVIYREAEPTATSLPRARSACIAVERTLKRIVDDIVASGTLNPENLKEAADTLVDNMIARPSTMIWLAKMRAANNNRYQQALTVSVHLTALDRQIGFPREQLSELATVGLLLDLGKLAIRPDLLEKAEPLTETETDILRGHVAKGLHMVATQGGLPASIMRAIAEHHERIDGTGYPMGLCGEEISVYGKMAAIADMFVAMITPRAYAPTFTAYDAIRELFHAVDSHLHGPLVEQFVQAIGIFPVGTLVELSSGQVAIIVEHNDLRRLEPKVLVLTDADKDLLDDPCELDMLRHNAHAVTTLRIVKGLVEGAYGIDFRKYYLNKS